MKVAFYLDNENFNNINCSRPDQGNMGIGGTEYMILNLSYYMAKKNNGIDVTIIAPKNSLFYEKINYLHAEDILKAIELVKDNEIDVFIFRGPFRNKKVYELLDNLKVKSIVWSHNYEDSYNLNNISNSTSIKAHVCVGKEQLCRLIDHKVIKKATYIYNGVNFGLYKNINRENNKINAICFVGALEEIKGFHKVAEIFNKLETKIPDLELHIIGGNLYKRKNVKMGEYNLAEELYEKKFIKYIIDENKKIKKNVKFFGVKSEKEKLELMSRCKVGIVNPTGQTESFCLVALEFQALGVPVISIGKYGLLDVVNYKYGILVKRPRYIKNKVNMVFDGQINLKEEKYYNKQFDIKKTLLEWEKILFEIYNNKEITKKEINIKNLGDIFVDYKILRILNLIFLKRFSLIDIRAKISNIKQKINSSKV